MFGRHSRLCRKTIKGVDAAEQSDRTGRRFSGGFAAPGPSHPPGRGGVSTDGRPRVPTMTPNERRGFTRQENQPPETGGAAGGLWMVECRAPRWFHERGDGFDHRGFVGGPGDYRFFLEAARAQARATFSRSPYTCLNALSNSVPFCTWASKARYRVDELIRNFTKL